jgi:hypothetical protein
LTRGRHAAGVVICGQGPSATFSKRSRGRWRFYFRVALSDRLLAIQQHNTIWHERLRYVPSDGLQYLVEKREASNLCRRH